MEFGQTAAYLTVRPVGTGCGPGHHAELAIDTVEQMARGEALTTVCVSGPGEGIEFKYFFLACVREANTLEPAPR